jgi:uncharacterized membrane protein YtjA (UPF0391 family)
MFLNQHYIPRKPKMVYLFIYLLSTVEEKNMPGLIGLAVTFLVLALIAYILGARGIAGFSMEIAKWLVIIFVILAIVSFVL